MNTIDRFQFEGLTLQQLRYFNAVAEGETFADAAATIGISQSALSQGIARLEQVAGARLLERDGRRRRLTDTGDLVASYARRVLGESETLASDLAAIGSGTSGRLRIGLIDAAALYLFNDQIATFQESHTEVAISMTVAGSDELEQALLDFRLDAAVVVGPARRVEASLLLAEPLHVFGRGRSMDDATWALYPAGSRTRDAVDTGLAAAGIDPTVTVESANPAVLREMAALTSSFTVLPSDVVGPSHGLRPIVENIARRDILLATRRATAQSNLVQAFAVEMKS